jgi:hypothetical protein
MRLSPQALQQTGFDQHRPTIIYQDCEAAQRASLRHTGGGAEKVSNRARERARARETEKERVRERPKDPKEDLCVERRGRAQRGEREGKTGKEAYACQMVNIDMYTNECERACVCV